MLRSFILFLVVIGCLFVSIPEVSAQSGGVYLRVLTSSDSITLKGVRIEVRPYGQKELSCVIFTDDNGEVKFELPCEKRYFIYPVYPRYYVVPMDLFVVCSDRSKRIDLFLDNVTSYKDKE